VSKAPAPPRFIGRYEILGELGRGAMGIVLLARDPVLERDVALKFLRPDLRLSEGEREALMQRMRQEARAIARVTHPGIVSLHDLGESEAEGVYLVFERVIGPTLEEALHRGRLTREGAARLARELGEGLTAAHARGVLHRDMKPGNVILTGEGAKIADFGVARLPDSTLTKAGARVGTPAYAAPEAIREGVHSAESDQFSLAATLYEAVSGQRAFPGDDAVTVAKKIETQEPAPVARRLHFPERVDRVLERGLAKNPSQRYPSCAAFGQALSEALVGAREIQPTLPDHRALIQIDRGERRKRTLSATLWLLVGAILASAVGRVLQGQETLLPTGSKETPLRAEPLPPPRRPAYISPMPD
jgi:serine/threonine protein kinase